MIYMFHLVPMQAINASITGVINNLNPAFTMFELNFSINCYCLITGSKFNALIVTFATKLLGCSGFLLSPCVTCVHGYNLGIQRHSYLSHGYSSIALWPVPRSLGRK